MKKMLCCFTVALVLIYADTSALCQEETAQKAEQSNAANFDFADVLEISPDVQSKVSDSRTFKFNDRNFKRSIEVTPCKDFSASRPVLVLHPWIVFIEREGEMRGAAQFAIEMKKLDLWVDSEEFSWPRSVQSVFYNPATNVAKAGFKIVFFPHKLVETVLQDVIMEDNFLRGKIKSANLASTDGIPEIGQLKVSPMPIDPRSSSLIVYYEDSGEKKQIGRCSFDESFDFLSEDTIKIDFDSPESLMQALKHPEYVNFEMKYGYKGAVGNTIRSEINFKRYEFQQMLQQKFGDGNNGKKWINRTERDLIEAEIKDNLHNYVSFDRNVPIDAASDAFLKTVLNSFLNERENFINLLMEEIKLGDMNNEADRLMLAEYLKPVVVNTAAQFTGTEGQTSTDIEREIDVTIESDSEGTEYGGGLSLAIPIYKIVVGITGSFADKMEETQLKEFRKELEKQLTKYASVTNSSSEGRIEYEIKKINLYRLKDAASDHVGQKVSETAYYYKLTGRQTTASFPMTFTTDYLDQIEVGESFNLFQEKLKTVKELERKNQENLDLFNTIIEGLKK